jgi:hypothetical protein
MAGCEPSNGADQTSYRPPPQERRKATLPLTGSMANDGTQIVLGVGLSFTAPPTPETGIEKSSALR